MRQFVDKELLIDIISTTYNLHPVACPFFKVIEFMLKLTKFEKYYNKYISASETEEIAKKIFFSFGKHKTEKQIPRYYKTISIRDWVYKFQQTELWKDTRLPCLGPRKIIDIYDISYKDIQEIFGMYYNLSHNEPTRMQLRSILFDVIQDDISLESISDAVKKNCPSFGSESGAQHDPKYANFFGIDTWITILSCKEAPMKTPRINTWLPLDVIELFEPLAEYFNVSEVARSPRGFLAAYKKAGGDPQAMSEAWKTKRRNFIRRHFAQVPSMADLYMIAPATAPFPGRDKLEEEGYDIEESTVEIPSRRHLAFIMWAYSPQPQDINVINATAGGKYHIEVWLKQNQD